MATEEVWSMVAGAYSGNFSCSIDQEEDTRTEEGTGSDLKALLKVVCLPALPMPEMFHNLQTLLAGDKVPKHKSQGDNLHSNHNSHSGHCLNLHINI